MSANKISAFDVALQELEAVAKVMHLSSEVVGFLSAPQRVMEVNVPLRLDNGEMRYFSGFRCHHNQALGPSRGGTRLHKEETIDDVKALAFWMTVKNSLANIPSGGGKGGIAVDPSTLSASETERLCRNYVRAIFPMMGPDRDVFGPDVGTPQHIMAWLLDEYETIVQHHQAGAVSGKPLLLGGSEGRLVATGYGLVYNASELMKRNNTSLEGKKIALQGFGNLGSVAAQAFVERGAKVIAVTNVHGGCYNAKGLDINLLAEHVKEGGRLQDIQQAEPLELEAIWSLDCDILCPCALQNAITEENAPLIKAKYLLEGANGPVTPAGEAILLEKGVQLMPGIAANCGGVLVSYFEQVQNRYCYSWSKQEVLQRLESIMTTTCAHVCQVAQEKKVSLRLAAWIVSLEKVINAMRLRGWVK